MNKRLVCLLLSLIMLFTVVLTSCSQKSDEDAMKDTQEKASKNTVTLTMYLMSDKEVEDLPDTTDDQLGKLEAAVNKITKSKFKTRIVLRYFTAEQYYEALDKAFKNTEDEREAKKKAEQALKEAIKNGQATAAVTTTADGTTEEATVLNEYGVAELAYPTVGENQVDIFYLGGYDKLMEYVESKRLSELDEELSSSSKNLTKYISSEYLKYSKKVAGETTYLIPNNAVIGEYTYLLLHKDILSQYSYSAKVDDFSSLTTSAVKDILAKVSKYNSDKFVPLYSTTGDALDISNVSYMGVDEDGKYATDKFSVIGGTTYEEYKYGGKNNYYAYTSIFADTSFRNQVETLISYKENGYYKEPTADKKFAVGYMKGSTDIAAKYADEYEVVVVSRPRLSSEDLFQGGFAVGKYTSDIGRAMEVITYLNTNVEFRNLIQYGIENENYELVDKDDGKGGTYKAVRRLNDSYLMSVEKTGNVLTAYPLETDPVNLREFQKEHINYARVMLDIGFGITEKDKVNLQAMTYVRELSAECYEKMIAMETVEEWKLFIDGMEDKDNPENSIPAMKDLHKNDEIVKLMTSTAYTSGYPDYEMLQEKYGAGCSLAYVYFEWINAMGIYSIEA